MKRQTTIGTGGVPPPVLQNPRVVTLNSFMENEHFWLQGGNDISTTKYSWWSFFPQTLYQAFRRLPNLYFLGIAVLSFTPMSPVSPATAILPLAVVISLTLIKEALEDLKRNAKDREVNESKVDVVTYKGTVQTKWEDINVGDSIKVYDGGYLPADVVLLSSSNSNASCFVDTTNLDGETNLKHKEACGATATANTDVKVASIKGSVECEQPNNSLYTFSGNMYITMAAYPLKPAQLLLRGSILRNTEHIYGVVVYAGYDTKVLRYASSMPSSAKASGRLDRFLNKSLILAICLQVALCLVGVIGSFVWLDSSHWYLVLGNAIQPHEASLAFDPSRPGLVALATFIGHALLYSSIVPVTLCVSIDVILYAQSLLVNHDAEMSNTSTGTSASARRSQMNETLGRVEYILTDKTGTLTSSPMELIKCSIGGVSYGEHKAPTPQSSSSGRGRMAWGNAPKSSFSVAPSDALNDGDKAIREKTEEKFYDRRLLGGKYKLQGNADAIREFFRLLAICHSVIPEQRTVGGKPSTQYQAASPDEAALVRAAHSFGYSLKKRELDILYIEEEDDEGNLFEQQYRILAVLEFNSYRKRQSVIVEMPDDTVRLYCKGADSVIIPRLGTSGNAHLHKTKQHLMNYGSAGLRTLCTAYRDIHTSDFKIWAQRFFLARMESEHRDIKMDAIAEEIENNLTLLGCTAINDKLGDNVPESIASLKQAGIKIWMLTGDKLETAINVSYACGLLNQNQETFMLTGNDTFGEEMYDSDVLEQVERTFRDASNYAGLIANDPDGSGKELALVMDSKVVDKVLASAILMSSLLEIGKSASSVICCRTSALQKVLVTKLVQTTGKVTLAVGDGANDVGMIQCADIGVGISNGQDGMHASLCSDYSMPRFSSLSKLLLIHGQWSSRRITRAVSYLFCKNLAYTFTLFWFNIHAAFSGQSLYGAWDHMSYTFVFSSLPVIVMGVVDQEISAKMALRAPELYRHGLQENLPNLSRISIWLGTSLWQSLVCFYVPMLALSGGSVDSDGRTLGLTALGTSVSCAIVLTVNIRILFECTYQTRSLYAATLGSILLWFAVSALPSVSSASASSKMRAGVVVDVLCIPLFWLAMLLSTITALIPDLIISVVARYWNPSDCSILQECEHNQERRRRLQPADANGVFGDEEDDIRMGKLPKAAVPRNVSQDESQSRLPIIVAGHNGSAGFERKRQTGFAFEDPHHEGYHALQAQRRHDLTRRQKRPSLDDSRLTMHINNLHSASTSRNNNKTSVSHAAMALHAPIEASAEAFPRSQTEPRSSAHSVQFFDD